MNSELKKSEVSQKITELLEEKSRLKMEYVRINTMRFKVLAEFRETSFLNVIKTGKIKIELGKLMGQLDMIEKKIELNIVATKEQREKLRELIVKELLEK